MARSLDPKIDVIFKLLFVAAENRRALIDLLSAVLKPRYPIAEVTILNPEIPKRQLDDKGTILDILVKLGNGQLINVEMQVAHHAYLVARANDYAARVYAAMLERGQGCEELRPVSAMSS